MNVLVVDDSRSIRMMVCMCINELGHNVIEMQSGLEAVLYMKSDKSEGIDLIIMDVEMPGLNGMEATEQIRNIDVQNWFPIIFLTALVDDVSYARGILAGGDAYLMKPLNPIRLQSQITAMERIYDMRQKLKAVETQLLVANDDLLMLSRIDQLTKLGNRRHFDETLAAQFGLAKRDKLPLSLIICDIDFFKLYNDTYGHQDGDKCLISVAQGLQQSISRPTDLACRYGGEEFTFILPATPMKGAMQIAENIRSTIEGLGIEHKGSLINKFVTLSLGVVSYDNSFSSIDKLVKAADDALYLAKDNGRNRVEAYTND